VASVELRDASGVSLGRRTLRMDRPSCRVMDEPLAVLIALTLDPESVAAAVRTAPTPAVTEVPRREVAPAAGDATEGRWFEGSVRVTGQGNLGLFPYLGLGARFATQLVFGALWRFELAATLWPELGPYQRFRLSSAHGGAAVCLAPFARAGWELGPCAGIEAAGLTIREQVDGPSYGNTAYFPLARAGFWVERRVSGPLAVRLDLDAMVPVARVRVERLTPTGSSPFYDVTPVTGTFGLSLVLRSR
jgi:hypothetical protein